MNSTDGEIDEVLSRALGGVNPSSTSKNKYRSAIAVIESALGLEGLLIKSLGAPKNYGNRISEATGTGARSLILVADGDVDHEALIRAYGARVVRPLPTLVALKEGSECVAVEVLTEGENPFPSVEARLFPASAVPNVPSPELLNAVLRIDGCGWEEAQRALAAHQNRWPGALRVKHAPDQKNLMNRIREAAGRRPAVLVVFTTPELRVSCGSALKELSDLVGEAVVVTDGRDGVRVELALAVAAAGNAATALGPGACLAPGQVDGFVSWNAALLRDFFSPTHHGEEVTLSASRPDLDDVAPELGGFEGLLQAVRDGPPWELPRGRDLTNLAVGLRHQRSRPRSRPPSYVHPTRLLSYGSASDNFPAYLPVLAALVALSLEYKHGEGGFYTHAQSRLSLGPSWGPGELERINTLWDDLESWTTETRGQYGIFRARVLGKRPVLGRLKSQSIIRDSDLDKLHRLFTKLDLPAGEPLVPEQIGRVLTRIQNEPILSQGLRDASIQADYRSALVERLDQILLDWDGSTATEGEGEQEPWSKTKSEYSKLGLVLFADGGRPPWRLGWRMPALQHDGHASLNLDNTACWRATFDGRPYAIAHPTDPNSGSCTPLNSPVQLTVISDDGFRPSQHRRPLAWSPNWLTVLEFSSQYHCLVEIDALPTNGPFYLLVSPTNENFAPVLRLAGIDTQTCPSQGLPSGWRLFHVPEAAALSNEQRSQLPGLSDGCTRSRAIRLVGGLRIRRAGRIAFLPHDLPMVEVDAPPDSEVRAPGLELTEVLDSGELPLPDGDGLLEASTRRTFELQVACEDRMTFTLTVAPPAGEPLGTAKLRLAVESAEQAEGNISLIPAWQSKDRRLEIQGMVVTGLDERPTTSALLDVPPHLLGGDSVPDLERMPLECPEMRFLDALSQGTGRMSYGRARRIMRRYLNKRDQTTTATFEALRQRGMLEIRSDSRGRWTTVGSVRPTLYALSMTVGGDSTWGICGTLRLGHWKELTNTGAKLFVARDQTTGLPVFRLRGSVTASGTFDLQRSQPTTIAKCSASLDELRRAMASRGFEALDGRAQDCEWFQPTCADWRESGPPTVYDWVLLRYTDPDTGSHRLHSLRSGQPGEHRYRHVRNERWATWMAYDSCVRHIETFLPGVAPWPLSYHSRTRSVWVPARMRLPLILERALVACSGAPPARARMVRDTAPTESRLRGCTVGGAIVGDFDRNYSDFLPVDFPRVWLEYRHVPADVVDILTHRLGCRLDEIGDPR